MIPLSRNGKIARLPKPIREELNRRLDQGVPGGPLLQWLNSLPEVQAVLAADFGGRPINKQSLSQWRHGGYTEWSRLRETRTLAGQILTEARELQPTGGPPLTDQLASWVLIRYLMVVRKLIGQTGAEKADFQLLHQFSRDLMAFQRGDHVKARLQFEWVRFKLLSGLQPVPAAPCPEPPKTEAGAPHDQPAPHTADHASRITYHAPPSAPVRPSQTFEIFKNVHNGKNYPDLPGGMAVGRRGWGFRKPSPARTHFHALRITHHAAPPSAPVSPGQTFEFLKIARHGKCARRPKPMEKKIETRAARRRLNPACGAVYRCLRTAPIRLRGQPSGYFNLAAGSGFLVKSGPAPPAIHGQ